MTFFKIKINGWHTIYSFANIKFKVKNKPKKLHKVNILFNSNAGIGNRINGLLNVISYFKPDIINFYWDNTGWVSSSFKELFSIECDSIINEYSEVSEMNNENSIVITNLPCFLKNLRGDFVTLKFNEIDKNSISEITNLFKMLKPTDKVLERINSFKYTGDFISLQVRNNKDWDDYGRNESLDLFFQEIEKFPKDTKFYLSAMNQEISKIFKDRYPNQILELPQKDYLSMFDAVADLYILSRGKNAIYSYGSTFADLAWWFSNGQQNVRIVGNESKWIK